MHGKPHCTEVWVPATFHVRPEASHVAGTAQRGSVLLAMYAFILETITDNKPSKWGQISNLNVSANILFTKQSPRDTKNYFFCHLGNRLLSHHFMNTAQQSFIIFMLLHPLQHFSFENMIFPPLNY